jgi:hypothetical protein
MRLCPNAEYHGSLNVTENLYAVYMSMGAKEHDKVDRPCAYSIHGFAKSESPLVFLGVHPSNRSGYPDEVTFESP